MLKVNSGSGFARRKVDTIPRDVHQVQMYPIYSQISNQYQIHNNWFSGVYLRENVTNKTERVTYLHFNTLLPTIFSESDTYTKFNAKDLK